MLSIRSIACCAIAGSDIICRACCIIAGSMFLVACRVVHTHRDTHNRVSFGLVYLAAALAPSARRTRWQHTCVMRSMSSRDTLDIIFLAASIICGSISASDISCEDMCATLHKLLH